MKFEFSAGGIVYKRKAKSEKRKEVSSKQEEVEILVAQHSQHHGWVFPKGLIGDHVQHEKKEETAIREVKEETGINAIILEPLQPITYWYQQSGERIKKTVYYYVMEARGGDITQRDKEMENVAWLPVDEVENRLTYPSDKHVWQEAKKLIAKN